MKKIVSFFGDRSESFVILNQKAKEYANSLGLEYEWCVQKPFSQQEVVAALQQADAGIIDVDPYNDEIFSQLPERTKILVRFGVGFDKVDLKAASQRGIAIARTAGANTLGVAEMAISLMLAAKRKLKLNDECVETVQWANNVTHELIGGTVGIVGFGAIGKALRKLLSGFDCEVLVYDPFLSPEAAAEHNVRGVSLEELFERSDAISVHMPYTPENHHVIGSRLIGRMKPTAVLVNTARGGLIDEDALYEALSERRILGAGLDVFEVEPLPSSSKLIGLDNIILTPHVSSQTMESLWRIYAMAIDITYDFFRGVESPNILNPDYKNR